jgi:hypothetical protein
MKPLPPSIAMKYRAANDEVRSEVAEDASACPQQRPVETKMAELEASNHKLRVENLALRSRLESLKDRYSLKRTVIVAGAISLPFLFILSMASKIVASCGL